MGIVENGRTVLGNAVASSLSLHEPYGGVIPEIAARLHVESIWQVMGQALDQAKLSPDEIDAVAVTQGPGLPGALLIGLAFAKGLALALDRPLVPVDHLAAHLYAGEMTSEVEPPYIGLIVSGGHTALCVAHPDCRYELLGETKDDAVGEAFDKVAKLLGLGYPGGPVIDSLSDSAKTNKIAFPRTTGKEPLDFSFSGLKTAVYQYVQKQMAAKKQEGSDKPGLPIPDSSLEPQAVADIAASFQEAAVDILVSKTLKAAHRAGVNRIVVGGGVASNRRLRQRFAEEASAKKLAVIFPPPALCVDNGAMVAGIGFPLLRQGRVAALSVKSDPHLCLT